MTFKSIKINYKLCLLTILCFCIFHNNSLYGSNEPIIRVLISKDNKLRIRSDRSIPLLIDGSSFSKQKIRGLTIKNENNKKILFFDKNKQKKYDLHAYE